MGPMTQPNRMPLPGLKPKDLVGIPWRVAFALQADGWWLRSDIIWSKPNPMPESVTDRPTKSHEYLFLLSKSEQYQYDYAAVLEEAVGETQHDLTGTGQEAPGQTPQIGNRKALPGPTYKRHRSSVPGGQDLRADPCAFRNRRTVWTVATEPTPEAHFAVMPTKLVQPCILAGCPALRCAVCGAAAGTVSQNMDALQGAPPRCSCGAGLGAPGAMVPGIVVDPFGGSGTVGRVAEDNGRQWILFDLSSKYAEIAKRKTAQTGLLGRVGRAD